MATTKSIKVKTISKEQIQDGCLHCKGDNKVQWKCQECVMPMCSRCKDTIHSKLENAGNHRILDIKDVGKISEELLQLKVINEYTTDMKNIHLLACCFQDDSLWLGDNALEVVQHVKPEKDSIKILSSFNIRVYDMAVISPYDILLSVAGEKLKLISGKTGQMTDSKFDIAPLITSGIHVTKDQKIIMGAIPAGSAFTAEGKRSVIVMDKGGGHLMEYEQSNGNPLFKVPFRITSTKSGNICVVDQLDKAGRGRLVVLKQNGDILQIYTGPHTKPDKHFQPRDVIITQSNKIILADPYNHYFHILTCDGEILEYYSTRTNEIDGPYSLALNKDGHLYTGCATLIGSSHSAKLYKFEYSLF